MSIQKKILYVVVIALAVIGLLSIIPMPEGYSFNMSNAMSPINDMEQRIEGRDGGYTVPDVPGGGGSGGGTSGYPTISYEGPINVPWSSPTVWEWVRPRQPAQPRVEFGEPYGSQGG